MVYALFIYGINIPSGRRFSRDKLTCELEREESPFEIVEVGPHGDTLVVRLLERSSPNQAAEWVVERIDRPAVLRPLGVIPGLYEHALALAKEQFDGLLDQNNRTVTQEGQSWELGAVFASLAMPVGTAFCDTTTVRVLGRYMNDTAVVLKREKRISGKRSRIMWGEEVNKVIRKPMGLALGREPVCTSRSISAVQWLAHQLAVRL